MTVLFDCTAEFSMDTLTWKKVDDSALEMGIGGHLIKGQENKLYYLGGFNPTTGNKSKMIFEYQSPGHWYQWPHQLNIDSDALNAWDVMELGPNFCGDKPNMTKAVSYEKGWILNKPINKSGVCVKNIFDGSPVKC